MGKRGLTIFFGLIFLLFVGVQNISAESTLVKITTYPNYDLNVNFLKPAPGIELYEAFNLNSGDDGQAELTFTSSVAEFDVSVFLMKDGKKVASAKFEENVPGESLHIKIYTTNSEIIKNFETVEFVKNDTLENDTAELNETNETLVNTTIAPATVDEQDQDPTNNPGITGLATDDNSGGSGLFSNTIFYFVAGLLVLGVVVYTGMLKLKTVKRREDYGEDVEKSGKEIKVKKLSEKLKEMKEDKKDRGDDYSRAIEEAERKIKEAQKDLDRLKNADKIEALKKKIEDNKKELEELQGSD